MVIYEFHDYKKYLQSLCHSERGMLTRLSEASLCQKSYLSSCLTGKNNITLDHASAMAEYLNLSEAEEDYFFLLIEKERAASPQLIRKLENKIKRFSRESLRLKNQQSTSVIISENDSQLGYYYMSWMPIAIHILTSIDAVQTPNQISKRLQIPDTQVQSFLDFLEKQTLIKKTGHRYGWNSANIHLADNSHWITTHHMNWRLRAIDNCQKSDTEALHYSVVQSMSEKDFELLKRKTAQFIKDCAKISDPSKPEEAYCFNLDFFKI